MHTFSYVVERYLFNCFCLVLATRAAKAAHNDVPALGEQDGTARLSIQWQIDVRAVPFLSQSVQQQQHIGVSLKFPVAKLQNPVSKCPIGAPVPLPAYGSQSNKSCS